MGYKVKRIMVWQNGVEKQVRPAITQWEVKSSTILYYPFADDNVDKTGKTSLSTGGTKQTIGYSFTGNVSYGSGTDTTSMFISYWLKVNSGFRTTGNTKVGIINPGKLHYTLNHVGSQYNRVEYESTTPNRYQTGTIATTGTWVHLAYGFDGTNAFCYINGVKTIVSTDSSYATDGRKNLIITDYGSASFDITLSDYIIDSVNRESEVLNVFNGTKSNYGL